MNTTSVKRFPLVTLAALSLLTACSNDSGPSGTTAAQPSSSAASTAPSESSTTPIPTPSDQTGSTTTPEKTPTTVAPGGTTAPRPTTPTGATPESVATFVASSLQAAFGQGNFAPQYQTIWENVKANGGTIRAVGPDAADPANPLRPQAAAKYSLTVGQTSFCITRILDQVSNTATFQTSLEKC